METFWQDMKYGTRLLAKNPGFALVAVMTLALGLGANTTIFSWLNSVLINSIPGAQNQSQLVMVVPKSPTFRMSSLSYPDYLDYREQNSVLQGLAIHDFVSLSLGGDANPERIYGEIVSANFFDVLGVGALHGRMFLPEEDTGFGGHAVLVISYPLWQRRFGGDPGVVGKTITVNRSPYTIVGIAPRGFQGGEIALSFDAWVPLTMYSQIAGDDGYKYRGKHRFASVARLKPGVSIEQTQAGLEVIARRLARQYPDTNEKWTVMVYPLWKAPYGAVEVLGTVLEVLMCTVGVVLLIACANVANLLLARAARRRREIAIRLSIGASRGRLLRQFLTESLLLSLLGGLVGIAVSLWTSKLLMLLAPPSELPIRIESGVDGHVVLFAFALSMVTGVVFGLAPALQSARINVVSSLKSESATLGWRWRKAWLRNCLVVSQVALSIILLIAASLVLRSLDYARTMKLGFQPRNVLLAEMDLFSNGYSSDQGRLFHQQLLDRLEGLPGIRSATLARRAPLGFGGQSSGTIQVEGYAPAKDETVWSCIASVGPNYFRVMEIPLVHGRDIARQDTKEATPVAIINEILAKRYWRDGDAMGRRVFWAGQWITIVGIARDSKYRNLSEPPTPYLFLPLQQKYTSTVTLFVRTEGDPARMVTAVTGTIKALDPALPIFVVRTLEEHIGAAAFQQRMASMLLGAFGILALILAAIGVFGVMSYTVTQQSREFGIRIALGARPHDLLWWVVRRGLMLAAIGIVLGLPAAWGTARLMRSLLLGVSASDPLTFAGVTLVLSGVAFAACLIPACRAARVDPIISLRYE